MKSWVQTLVTISIVAVSLNSFAGSKSRAVKAAVKEVSSTQWSKQANVKEAVLKANKSGNANHAFITMHESLGTVFVPTQAGKAGKVLTFINDGPTYTKTSFKIPETTLAPTESFVASQGIWTGVKRKFNVFGAKQSWNQLFEVTEINGVPLRKQRFDSFGINGGGGVSLDLETPNRIGIRLDGGPTGKDRYLGEYILPKNVEGQIIGFHANAFSGDMTVQVVDANGKITERSLKLLLAPTTVRRFASAIPLEVEEIGVKVLSRAEIEKAGFIAEMTVMKPRQSASSSVASRGLRVDTEKVTK